MFWEEVGERGGDEEGMLGLWEVPDMDGVGRPG